MGVASKFLMLLSTPFPLLHPRCYAYRLTRHSRLGLAASLSTATSFPCHHFHEPLLVYPRRQRASFSLRAAEEFHTGTAARVDHEQLPDSAKTVNSWPEWSRFVEHVSTGACGGAQGTFLSSVALSDDDDDDSFDASFGLPEDFARAAEACLAFARERPVLLKLLSKGNIKILVDNNSPFLFKNGLNSSRRMARYLSDASFSLSETGAAQTVDLMRYLLSYSYNQLVTSEVGKFSASKLVQISVNDLLDDMVNSSSPVRDSHVSMSSFEQISRSPSQYFEMKRGDWMCPNCTYINFGRNMKCLKCDDGRPKRQLTGGDWQCPQCSFYNYGKNMACLRCDCMRPMSSPHKLNQGYQREPDLEQICRQGSSSTSGVDRPLLNKDEKAEKWFDKVVETNNSAIADEYLPDVMPSQDDPKRLANTTKRFGPQADRSNTLSVNMSGKGLDSSITRSLENLLGQSSRTLDSVNTPQKKDAGSVPLPQAMFKNIQSSSTQEKHLKNGANFAIPDPRIPSKRPQGGNQSSASHNYNNEKQVFSASGYISEPDDKKLTSSVSNDDFPEIMPIRRGENRFVVSRKKDRSLTSPQYKRRLAMEQASGSNFVPFVPFPPGYFARKDNQGGDGAPINSETVNTTGKSDAPKARDTTGVAELDVTQRTRKSWNSESSGRNSSIDSQMNPASTGGFNSSPRIDSSQMRRTGDSSQVGGSPVAAANSNILWNNNDRRTNVTGVDYRSRDFTDKESTSSWNRNEVNRNSGFWGKNQPNDKLASAKPNSSWNGNEQSSRNGHSSWNNSNTHTDGISHTGKSLEGSAVPQEPDPLDMSEEAKAQRWFRRVAQITDISELSKIPDEDFPEIMPMRKGVNRFVVSKRKTPLERRLTSPQYRRNLPIVSSDPAKDSNQKI